jgi:hypothetical protein
VVLGDSSAIKSMGSVREAEEDGGMGSVWSGATSVPPTGRPGPNFSLILMLGAGSVDSKVDGGDGEKAGLEESEDEEAFAEVSWRPPK